MKKILIIQTASIGDVILVTPILEKLHLFFPQVQIDVLLKRGTESLFKEHPFLNEVLVWDKRQRKYKNLFALLGKIRKQRYDLVVNVQRFASSGFVATFSKAKQKVGFSKNPFSFFYTKRYEHKIDCEQSPVHEVERNLSLISDFTDKNPVKPKLYPSEKHFDKVLPFKTGKYICIAPASLWFTKQFPKEKWIEFLDFTDQSSTVFLLGGKSDENLCDEIKENTKHPLVINLAGALDFLETVALMKDAQMNYVNDSAPMHLASSINAPTSAIFCSTVPAFGFGPLSDEQKIVETKETLSCRPCGLHGYKECPEKHFRCALTIDIKEI